ncbi:MAG: nucleotide exchange factor GrpE [Alphaproteobacteria bacterium]|nr:nucleotide exchange factor GrpE [Alphaproteobacteria bacterium]
MTGKDQAKDRRESAPEDVIDESALEAARRAAEAAGEAPPDGAAEGEAAGAAAGAAADGAAEEDAVARLTRENEELKDRMLRVVADAENTKRRAEKDAADARKYAAASFVKEMLPAIDNLRRAVDSVPDSLKSDNETVKNLTVGVEMTEKQMLDALEKGGVRRIDPAGEKFSYERHQAISEATGTGHPAGTVVQVLQPGYLLHDRLLRPAMVVVAKGDPAAAGGEQAAPDAAKSGDDDGVDTTA